jgi:hypothetical protein
MPAHITPTHARHVGAPRACLSATHTSALLRTCGWRTAGRDSSAEVREGLSTRSARTFRHRAEERSIREG